MWYNRSIEKDAPALYNQPGTRVPTQEVDTMNNDTPTPVNGQAPAYVYLIQAESGPVKIGIANDPSRRLSDLQTANYELLTLMYRIECNSPEQALMVERALHERYSDQCIRGEWFDIDPQSAVKDIEFATALSQAFRNVFIERVNEVHVFRELQTTERDAPKLQAALEWLIAHPEQIDTESRALTELIGVSHMTINKAQRIIKEGPNNADG